MRSLRAAVAVQALEARCLPTTFVVDNVLDTADGDFSAGQLTLREAIGLANAQPGTDVILFDGALSGQTITLSGTHLTVTDDLEIAGPGATQLTIDGAGLSRLFLIDGVSSGPIDVAVSGLTLAHGAASGVTANDRLGGAVFNDGARLDISSAKFLENTATNGGGGLYNAGGTVTISSSRFEDNTASAGGALATVGGHVTVSDSHVSGGEAQYGGGLYSTSSGTLHLQATTVSDNAALLGGGIYNGSGSSLIVELSTLSANHAAGDGGGVYLHYGTARIANSTLSGNTTDGSGGGLFGAFGQATFRNATITLNWADVELNGTGEGGGIFTRTGTSATTTLLNTLVIANLGGAASDDVSGRNLTSGSAYNLIGDSASAGGLTHGPGGNQVGNAGAGSLNPLSVLDLQLSAGGGPTQTHQLLATSPAIDAGNNNIAIDGGLTTDQRGGSFTRAADGNSDGSARVDIGAYERQPLLVTTAADELDWSSNSIGLSLREAVEIANTNDGADVIEFDAALSGAVITLSGGPLTISDSVLIAGLGAAHLTIHGGGLSRLLEVDHVDLAPAGFAVTLQGLTLTGGAATEDGGAILNEDADLSLVDVVVTGNLSFGSGGGISSGFFGSLSLTDSRIENNVAGASGGGLYNSGGILELTRSHLEANVAGQSGGGLFSNGGDLIVSQGAFVGNLAQSGGGLFGNGADLTMLQTEVRENQSTFGGGGGLFLNGGNSVITESTIADNTASSSGGGVGTNGADLIVERTLLEGNLAGADGGGISAAGGALWLVNSTLSENRADWDGGGLKNTFADVTLVQATIFGNLANGDGDGFGTGGGVSSTDAGSTTTTLFNSLVLGNLSGASPNDLAGRAVSTASTHSLVGHAGSSGGLVHGVNGHIVGQGGAGILNPADVLDPVLADNGGPTGTHALVTDSPAIDTGSLSRALDPFAEPLTTDQRGKGFLRRFGLSVDMGAVEHQPSDRRAAGLVARASSGTFVVAHSDGAQFETVAAGVVPLSVDWDTWLTGDFDADGHTDLAGHSPGDGQWRVLLWDGTQFSTLEIWGGWNANVSWTDHQVGDFNGDGRDDVAARAATGVWSVGLSTGSGFAISSFGSWSTNVTWHDVQVGDFDGDGRSDIVGRASTGSWVVGRSTGAAFVSTAFGAWSRNVAWTSVTVGDFDGDGRTDIAGRGSSGSWVVGLSNGSRFVSSVFVNGPQNVAPEHIRFGDFNGDGRTDVAGRTASGSWVVGLSDGTRFVQSVFGAWSTSVLWLDVVVGDFNADGIDDLAGRSSTGAWVVGLSDGVRFQSSVFARWSTNVAWDNVHVWS